MKLLRFLSLGVAGIALALFFAESAFAETLIPSVTINTAGGKGMTGSEVYTGLKLTILISSLVYLPSLIMTATCFSRIAIVLSMVRHALGTAQTPPNQVLIGMALFLTFAVMSPVFSRMIDSGINPYMDGKIDEKIAVTETLRPLREFMFRQTRDSDMNLMLDISRGPAPQTFDDLPTSVLIPAFILSELKTAFQIGFMLYIPFVVIDMIISMILLAMGMMVLPPVLISLPFKVMLFVLVDGWDLVISSLIQSFR